MAQPRREPHDESLPLADFDWCDEIIGIGFFPDEVLLGPERPAYPPDGGSALRGQ
jgi:hypothetical protein